MPFNQNDVDDLDRAKPFVIGVIAVLVMLRGYPANGPRQAIQNAMQLWDAWFEEFNS